MHVPRIAGIGSVIWVIHGFRGESAWVEWFEVASSTGWNCGETHPWSVGRSNAL